MEAITQQVLALAAVQLLMCPLVVWLVKRFVGARMDAYDEKRELARIQQAENEKRAREQREAERTIILAMSRSMLLNNYERCVEKGYYSLEERDVYHKLYAAYKADGGNSVIDETASRIRKLPIEPPEN